jgi:iron complex outermembrane receptor protein
MVKKVILTVCFFAAMFDAAAQSGAVVDSLQRRAKMASTRDSLSAPLVLSEEIVVYGDVSFQERMRTLNSTDDALSLSQSVQLMRRANFAQEPMIRGMSGGQIAVTIDGMKMHSACVDRMDPVTAYLEIENIEKLDVAAGAKDLSFAQTIGGSLNFVTTKPDLERAFFGKLETGYEAVSGLFRARGEVNLAPHSLVGWAMRGSFSVKRSGDFYAGLGERILNSGYSKENVKFNLVKAFGTHKFSASYIGDFARNIGYPALIMDATRTDAHIFSLDYEARALADWLPLLSVKVYTNQVLHWMDDYSRTVREIRERVIMPDMFMPMYGDNRTSGLLLNATILGGTDLFKVTLDAHHVNAFADMEMRSIFPDVAPMYLVNLGDLTTWNAGISVDYTRFISPRLTLRANGRLDLLQRDAADELSKRQFQGYVSSASFRLNYLLASLIVEGGWQLSAQEKISVSVARASRAPTYIENYGFYLYNPLDNSIYIGNPNLEPERSWQTELAFEHRSGASSLKAKLFYTQFDNYIAGLTFINANPNNRQFSQAFRRYQNMGSAVIAGVETSAQLALSETVDAAATLAYQFGESLQLGEPLPFMPPLSGNVRATMRQNAWQLELATRFALQQTRVAQAILVEDVTPAWIVFDVRFGVQPFAHLSARFGIENLFDARYHEHFSINNLPGRGRNFYITLGYEIL